MTKNGTTRMLREIPSSMDDRIVAQIDARLAAIRKEHNVKIPLAIESGSRAWGFPSPDSDYDCRFIYVRPAHEYLSLWPGRDVIETPLDDMLDVNGWDLGKALKLLLKGNAVVIEWLTSPISYATDPAFKDEFTTLARGVADRLLIGRHYLHLGERQRRTYFRDGKPIQQKKIFYALRPAAALRWLRHHPQEAIAPMHFPTLLAECAPPSDVSEIVHNLIARKALTRELGSEPLSDPIRQFIDAEFQRARELFEVQARPASPEARQRCNDFFVTTLRRLEEV
jgi:predicted nucleotidyltransferase